MSRLLNFVLFYLGWFACVAGAGRGHAWLGPLVVAAILALHLALASQRLHEAALIVATGLLGFVVETSLASLGLYSFTHTSVVPWLCPPWMIALWMLFASTLNLSMNWLSGRTALAAALGALFGPLSYLAGARLGAIELPADAFVTLTVLAAVWAATMPALLRLGGALRPAAGNRAAA